MALNSSASEPHGHKRLSFTLRNSEDIAQCISDNGYVLPRRGRWRQTTHRTRNDIRTKVTKSTVKNTAIGQETELDVVLRNWRTYTTAIISGKLVDKRWRKNLGGQKFKQGGEVETAVT
jgi:hypothetical protein